MRWQRRVERDLADVVPVVDTGTPRERKSSIARTCTAQLSRRGALQRLVQPWIGLRRAPAFHAPARSQ